MTDRKPWIALLGWFPPIYLVGLFAHHDKPWVQTNGWLGGNTPIFWWPTRLYKYQQRRLDVRRILSASRRNKRY